MPLVLGGIVMWSGLIAEIPEGWQLCDGTNGTPDLRNRFVVGAGNNYAVGSTGGSADAVLVSHTHTTTVTAAGNHSHSISYVDNSSSTNLGGRSDAVLQSPVSFGTSSVGNHTHTTTLATEGQTATNANLPPYYALAFIQQVQ